MPKVLVTGSKGFIGKNLIVKLREVDSVDIVEFHREIDRSCLPELLNGVDFVFHLAGINRPKSESEFTTGNADFTRELVDLLIAQKSSASLLYTSSIQAENKSAYGVSKKKSEQEVFRLGEGKGFVYRLPNVFGKWSRPNYNSVVATFCHNVSRGLPIKVNDPSAEVQLVYIDDVVEHMMALMNKCLQGNGASEPSFQDVQPVYQTTVGALARQIEAFKESYSSLIVENVGHGLKRALHATYMSFFEPSQFSYTVPKYEDARGVFVEMLKTKDAGQMSFFTARPGVTRGGHYHHTKTEKFLVLRGKARYRFRHILTQENYELVVDSSTQEPTIVETVPGWTHDITNVGTDELIVMLWANEIFDREKPDTKAQEV